MKQLTTARTTATVFCGALSASAQCKYDIVGTTQMAPTIALLPDGQVTFGMQNWWEDDVYACYNALVTPVYLPFMPGCDLDGSGLVEMPEVMEMYEYVTDYPTGTVPAYAYQCPTYDCPADMPEFYDVTQSDEEWVASGVCAQLNGLAGPPACPQAQHANLLAQMNDFMVDYPFTAAVFDGNSTGGQSFNPDPYAVICAATEPGETFDINTFYGIHGCYQGSDAMVSSSNLANIKFDWGVNVERALSDYLAVAQQAAPSAICELSTLIGAPNGFQASDAGGGWTLWTVRSTADCDYHGCRCEATLTIYSDADSNYFFQGIENNSGPKGFPGSQTDCQDSRFFGL